ncbi:unnamed protein product [Ceutorhynchus assimilis]|uniref:RRM domain-containing protein n=1 Tax=Ceutorhynchus assimilis TaxID=467358 RepID=A0A9N9MWX4_9CUCU|nr:unnamed protein product [Ceutorhynchus assimilis]
MSDTPAEQIKKFVFTSNNSKGEALEIFIPELLQASYSFYTWPSAPVLAWFLWENRADLKGKRVLELGSGTALPGILAAKCGASVTLSDSATLPKSLAHTRRSCQLNNLSINEQIKVIGVTWGLFLSNLDCIGPIDLILGSDCFFEPATFEDIIVTVSYLLENNIGAKFFCTYQERSSDWSIEHLLEKWNLTCKVHNISTLGSQSGIDIHEIIGGLSIHLLEISCKTKFYKLFVSNLPWTVSHQELRQYFSKFGPVNVCTVVFDRSTGLSKRFGFVSFGNRQGFEEAQSAQEHKIEGQIIQLAPANQENNSSE